MSIETHIAGHYAQGTLEQRILIALRESGKDPDRLDPDDLAPVDEFHHGGRAATAAFAPRLKLRPGINLLEIGSGIGGPARYFARHHGCRVTGIDLTEEFVAVSRAPQDQTDGPPIHVKGAQRKRRTPRFLGRATPE